MYNCIFNLVRKFKEQFLQYCLCRTWKMTNFICFLYSYYYCYISSVLIYECEVWTVTPELEKNIKADEMQSLRRIIWIQYTDRVTNAEVLRRGILSVIMERHLQFLSNSSGECVQHYKVRRKSSKRVVMCIIFESN